MWKTQTGKGHFNASVVQILFFFLMAWDPVMKTRENYKTSWTLENLSSNWPIIIFKVTILSSRSLRHCSCNVYLQVTWATNQIFTCRCGIERSQSFKRTLTSDPHAEGRWDKEGDCGCNANCNNDLKARGCIFVLRNVFGRFFSDSCILCYSYFLVLVWCSPWFCSSHHSPALVSYWPEHTCRQYTVSLGGWYKTSV